MILVVTGLMIGVICRLYINQNLYPKDVVFFLFINKDMKQMMHCKSIKVSTPHPVSNEVRTQQNGCVGFALISLTCGHIFSLCHKKVQLVTHMETMTKTQRKPDLNETQKQDTEMRHAPVRRFLSFSNRCQNASSTFPPTMGLP